MSLKERAARGALWAAVEVWGTQALQFVLFLVLTRLLGPEVYGQFALAMIVLLVGQAFVVMGGWIEALIQKRDLAPEHLDSVFWGVLGLGLLIAVLALALAPLAAHAFGDPSLEALMPALGLAVPLTALNIVPVALLQRELRLAPLALRSTLGASIAGVIGIAMAVTGWGVWSLVGYELTQPLVAVAVFWTAQRWRPRRRFSGRHLAEIARFSRNVIGERLLTLGDNLLPRVVIGAASGAAPLGQWSMARKVFELASELVQRPLLRVAMPSFSAAQAEPQRLAQMLTLAMDIAALAVVPCYLLLGVLAPTFVPLLFGPAWAPAAPLLQVLAVVGVLTPAQQLSGTLLLALGRADWSFRVAAAGFALLALTMLTLAPLGPLGVAVAFAVRAAFILPARLFLLRRFIAAPFAAFTAGMLRVLAAGLLMLAAMLAARAGLGGALPPLLELALTALTGGLAYLAGLGLFARPLARRGLSLAQSALRRPKQAVAGQSGVIG